MRQLKVCRLCRFPSSRDCESIHVGGALAPIFGAKAPPTINKTMTYTSLKDDVSYFQEYFHRLWSLGTSVKNHITKVNLGL